MGRFTSFLDGNKTKIAAVLTAAIGIGTAFGVVVPNWLVLMLAGFGLYSVRDAISKLEDQGEDE